MNNYEKLREMLHTHPSGAPASHNFTEILKILFSPDEAAIACHMSFMARSADEIAGDASLPVDRTEALLRTMADRVVINSREKDGTMLYSLLPTVPGLFEIPFMKGETSPMHEKLASLWDEYNKESMIESLCGNPTPQMRVVPVQLSLPQQSSVHSYEEVAGLIDKSGYISVGHCACKISAGKCDAPREVCFFFGNIGRALVEKGKARELDRNKALEILRMTEEAGLVHMSNNSSDKAMIICNCCPCCCHFLRGYINLKNKNAVAPSSIRAEINSDMCTNCGICYNDRCPVEAIEYEDDTPSINGAECIGCGLCASACPSDAIQLIQREGQGGTPSNIQEMIMKMLKEKNRLDDFIKMNMK